MNRYYRLSRSFTDNRMLPVEQNPYTLEYVNPEEDWYISLYIYNENHHAEWKKTKSFAGMEGVTTNQIVFDADCKNDLDVARKDILEILARITQYNIPQKDIQICFSGKKGFYLKVKTEQEFTPEELKNLTGKLAEGLETYDPLVYDSQRIFRMMGTRHQDTGYYKIPLSIEELESLTIDEIKELASDYDEVQERLESFSWGTVNLPDKIYNMRIGEAPVKKTSVPVEIERELEKLNLNDRPKWLSPCKFVLQEGFFGEGNRREALMILAATYKAQGFHQDMVYRMLKGVAEKQAVVQDTERLPDEEMFRVAKEVCSDKWKGGQYTCKSHPFLAETCERLGSRRCAITHHEDKVITLVDVKDSFKEYVKNIDQNTILTGIPTIDKNVFISTGVNMGILGAPGSGKTSLALDILNNTSKAGVHSVFASLDMHKNRMFEKVMYRISGLPREQLYKIFQNDMEEKLLADLKTEFGNVNFYNKSCPTVQDIKNYVIQCQEQTGHKIKLVMLDYFERVGSDFSDDTQASKRVAGELQDLVNDLDIALITLVQPNKMGISGGADTPIYNFGAIKGSSFVSQAFRVIMSLWRPFYNPKDFSNDHYMQMAVLKNDLGELQEFCFGWNGKKGRIHELEDWEISEVLNKIRQKEERKAENGW